MRTYRLSVREEERDTGTAYQVVRASGAVQGECSVIATCESRAAADEYILARSVAQNGPLPEVPKAKKPAAKKKATPKKKVAKKK